MRSILLWLLGVPIPIIILLALFCIDSLPGKERSITERICHAKN